MTEGQTPVDDPEVVDGDAPEELPDPTDPQEPEGPKNDPVPEP